MDRPPDFVIGNPADPYLLRWWVIPRNRWFNIYRHRILKSDDDRALHDHPWVNISLVLSGAYREITTKGAKVRRRGSIIFRLPSAAHRLEVVEGPVETLFITGPVVRDWGFLCPNGWRHWLLFTSPANPGEVGRGCE